MRERGVIDRIREKMLPDMPKCQALTTFHSARIADVYSAFIILLIGVVTSLSLGLFERIWYQRRNVKKRLIRGIFHHRGLARRDKTLRGHESVTEKPFVPTITDFRRNKNLIQTRRYLGDQPSRAPSDNETEKFRSLFNTGLVSVKSRRTITARRTIAEPVNVTLSRRDKHRIFPFRD